MNNDRLKFRVWNKKSGTYDSQTTFILFDDGTLGEFDYSSIHNQDWYVVEQCTGLKDKNGNLIYIGDIIKCGNGPLNTATVQYENGENFIDGIHPFNLYHDCGDECHCQLRDFPEYACEIIGNIHKQAEQNSNK